jgi:DNA-binding transcriptional LysR family regulator
VADEPTGLSSVQIAIPDIPQILSAEAAAAGEGVALLSPRFVAHYVAAGRLVQPFKRTIHSGDYFLAWLKERRAEEPIATLRKWLKAEATRASSGD